MTGLLWQCPLTRNTVKMSPNTAAARRNDRVAIAELLQPASTAGEGERLAAEMEGLEVKNPERRRLEGSFAAFAKARSVARKREID